MITDAHQHLWDPAQRPYPWLEDPALAPIRRPYGLEDLRREAQASGVTQTILVQTVPTMTETADFLRIAADSAGLIRGVVGWVDLTDHAAADAIAELRAGRGGELLVGIRHQAQDEPDPDWLRRDDVLHGLTAVARAGLVNELLVRPHQLPAAVNAVQRVPEGRFVLDHAAKPAIRGSVVEPWASDLRRLAAQPNVACKLSGLVTEADWASWSIEDLRPYAEMVLHFFGPRRVMAGSDWPVCELAASYTQVWDTVGTLLERLSPGERDDVLGATAARVYAI